MAADGSSVQVRPIGGCTFSGMLSWELELSIASATTAIDDNADDRMDIKAEGAELIVCWVKVDAVLWLVGEISRAPFQFKNEEFFKISQMLYKRSKCNAKSKLY